MAGARWAKEYFYWPLSYLFCIALPAALKADPHVYVDVDMHIETAPDGGLKQIHYIWTFDDLYSAFSAQ